MQYTGTYVHELHDSGLFIVLFINHEGKILYKNTLAGKYIEASESETLFHKISRNEADTILAAINDLTNHKKNIPSLLLSLVLNKQLCNFEIYKYDVSNPGSTVFCLTGTTISERNVKDDKKNLLQEIGIFINNMNEMIVVTDNSDTVLLINQAFANFAGISFKEAANKTIDELLSGKLSALKNFILSIHPKHNSNLYKFNDTENKSCYEINYNRSLNGTILIIKDITKDESTRLALEQSKKEVELKEEKFKKLLSNSSDVIFIVDSNSIIRFASYPIFNSLGYLPEEVEGASGFNYIHPDDIIIAEEAFQKVLTNSGDIKSYDIRIKNKKKEWIWMEIMGVNLFNEPLINGILINLNQISVRKEAELQVARSYEILTTIFESSLDGILLSNSSGKILKINKSLCNLLGYQPDELMKLPREKIIHTIHTENLIATDNHFIKETTSIITANGLEIPVDIFSVSITDLYGEKLTNTIVKDRRKWIKREAQRELSLDISNELNKYQDLQSSLFAVLSRLRSYLKWDLIELWIPNYTNTQIHLIAHDIDAEKENVVKFLKLTQKNEFTFSNYGKVPAYKNKEPYWMEDIERDTTMVRKKIAVENGLRSALAFPVINEKKVVGLMYLFSTEKKEKDTSITDLFQIMCNQIGAELAKRKKEIELDYFFALNKDIMAIFGTDGYFKKINQAGIDLLGYTEEELLSKPASDFIYKGDKNLSDERLKKLSKGEVLKPKAYRYLTKNNRIKWLEWNSNFLAEEEIIITNARDITEQKKQQQILRLEKNILVLLEKSAPDTGKVLSRYLLDIEDIFEGAYCSILGLNETNNTVYTIAAPSLPKDYVGMIDGLEIGPAAGSCGTAMYQKKTIIVSSIENDPLWSVYKAAALPFNLKACWSIPIISSQKKVMASFAIYYKEEKKPEPFDVELIEYCSNFLSIIIENIQAKENLRISNEMYKLATKATNEVIRDLDLQNNTFHWSDGFYNLFGYKKTEENKELHFWQRCIHPKDRANVISSFNKFISSHKNTKWQEEYRFQKADESYAYIIDKGYLLYNKEKKAYRMIGAMLDITERKLLEKELLEQELLKQNMIAQAVLETQETERTDIGKELHDNINQLLTITKLYIEMAKSDKSKTDEFLQRSANNISESIKQISAISKALIPSGIDDFGLTVALKDLIESILITNKINIEFYPIGNIKSINNKNLELTIYRIIQEQLNNIIKHSEGKNVYIELTKHNKQIELNIKDDGKGFDLNSVKRGLGLSNIQSRTLLYNGTVTFTTKPGTGCRLKVLIPLTKTIKQQH